MAVAAWTAILKRLLRHTRILIYEEYRQRLQVKRRAGSLASPYAEQSLRVHPKKGG